MSTLSTNAGQALLTLIKEDALSVLSGPLVTFFTADAAAQADPAKIAAAAFQLEGNLAPALPQFLGELNTAIANLAIAKIEAAQAVSATPAAKPA